MADETKDEVPSGMPEGQREEPPLGVDEADPDGEDVDPGAASMPGIPTDGEPPAAS